MRVKGGNEERERRKAKRIHTKIEKKGQTDKN